ncbi:polysaccharide deacetylase family protein [Ferviditalea candida]|uniref:Polysaccharide deacetylase family protein n=1 Tax=Ferviditalea candida TaxID=3108399 RepID=A0ABU5ZMP0_9BACL|nr:polysaccharide deacetylase family protein [Paenibacillaceae bacterium T2]
METTVIDTVYGNQASQAIYPVPAASLKPSLPYHDKVAVLMFHHLDPKLKGRDIISPELFAQQIDYLSKKGIHFISLDQFRAFMHGGKVPDNAALITFDDGYESYYSIAYPILAKRHIPAVCFVITGAFQKNVKVYTPHMTTDQIVAMTHADPDMEVQAHTDNLHFKVDRKHDALTGPMKIDGKSETQQQYEQRIKTDLQKCVQQLSVLTPHPIDTFAYPYGMHNNTAIKTLKEVQIRYAFTTRPGLISKTSDPYLLPRINGGSPDITPEALYASIESAAAGSINLHKSQSPKKLTASR